MKVWNPLSHIRNLLVWTYTTQIAVAHFHDTKVLARALHADSSSTIAFYDVFLLCCLQAGMSALMNASANGHVQIVGKLISAGANLDLQCNVRECGVTCGLCWRLMCTCERPPPPPPRPTQPKHPHTPTPAPPPTHTHTRKTHSHSHTRTPAHTHETTAG